MLLRGIDDARRLLGFFAAKNHHNLVLRVADVLEMRNDLQDRVAFWRILRDGDQDQMSSGIWYTPRTRKLWFNRIFPSGWIVLPFRPWLESRSMDYLVLVQEVIYAYADIRRQKGEPCRIDTCAKCGGSGRLSGRRCQECNGEGRIITFIEMSDEEIELAEAKV